MLGLLPVVRLEEELQNILPEARIARMDRDTTTRKGSHLRLIEATDLAGERGDRD